MATGETKFECGRYRNKTYEFVANIDKEFCSLALESAPNRYCPQSFQNYLKCCQKPVVISEPDVSYFVRALVKQNLRDELVQLVGNPQVVVETIHHRLGLKSNGYKGVFFRYAFLKYVFNVKGEKAHLRAVNVFVNVFPFKIEPNVRALANTVISQLDDMFVEEIRDFSDVYFDDINVVERIRDVIDEFLSNIVRFQRHYFVDDTETEAFKRWVENGFVTPKPSTSFNGHEDSNSPMNAFLGQFPRLNVKGVNRYGRFHDNYNEIAQSYGREPLIVPTVKELTYLPETNIYHLLSLLDCEFFHRDRAQYVDRFKKYLLFFLYSSRNPEESAVFFIDDCLYECTKAYATYRRHGTDPVAFKFELSLCALMLRRKQPHDNRHRRWYKIENEDLVCIKEVAESYPKILTAKIQEEIKNEDLEKMMYLRTDDDLLRFRCSLRPRKNINEFLVLIVSSALYDCDFHRLVIYNSLLGEKSWIKIAPENKSKIKEFIAKYNKYDSTQKLPPIKRLTWGVEDCFVDDTIYK